MSDFAEVTFTRIKEQYANIDVGAGALFAVIAEHIGQQQLEFPYLIAEAAMRIFSPADDFIIDDETSNTDVFLEVFRRVVFQPLDADATDEERELHRIQVVGAATYLGNFRVNILRQM